jgi:hypothetical protein
MKSTLAWIGAAALVLWTAGGVAAWRLAKDGVTLVVADGGDSRAVPEDPMARLAERIDELARGRAALVAALEREMLTSESSPLAAALSGLLDTAKATRESDPESRSVAVLVTAGLADGCDQGLNELAARAYDDHGIPTFVLVPMGLPSLDALNALAASGGTHAAFVMDGTGDPLRAALRPIQRSLSCELGLAEPPPGDPFVLEQTVAELSLEGAPPVWLERVDGAPACGGKAGWYFDDNDAPTSLVFCPELCNAIVSARSAAITVYFFCGSSLPPPPRP